MTRLPPPRNLVSDYMNFAKLHTAAKYGLASSGVADCTMADLDPKPEDFVLHGRNSYGYGPLIERIASRFSIPEACVVEGAGASFANHLAMAAILSPGDEVLIEAPAYELLLAALGYFQAEICTVARRPRDAWALNVEAVIDAITPRTRLLVLTNLHNPTGALTSEADLKAISQAADRVGALVLLDEIYLELMFRDGVARTAFSPESNFVITSSLTKAYGVSGLRCGWILAPAPLAEKMRRLNDLFASLPAHVAERLSVRAFDRLPALRLRANAMIDANRDAYREILGGHGALEQVILDQGTTMFPRLVAGDGEAFYLRLMADYETSVVPGRFFGCPEHIRIGLAGDVAMTRVGLKRIAEALG